MSVLVRRPILVRRTKQISAPCQIEVVHAPAFMRLVAKCPNASPRKEEGVGEVNQAVAGIEQGQHGVTVLNGRQCV